MPLKCLIYVLLSFGQLVYTSNLAWGKLTIIGVCPIAYNLTITHWAAQSAHVSLHAATSLALL